MLELNDVSKYYGAKKALDRVSLCVGPGEIVGLFGENGAGKSTLMKSVLGFHPYVGQITLDGEPVGRKNVARLSFATCEHSFFPGLSARGHMDFYREYFPRFSEKRFLGLMDFFNLSLGKNPGQMSAGQQNQFEVILALSQGADYILMDEPFAGNDVFNREDFYKVLLGILGENETVILSTHLIEEVAGFISRAVLIREGRIIGDRSVSELEDEGTTLMEYIKRSYGYRADRVSKALGDITGEDRQ